MHSTLAATILAITTTFALFDSSSDPALDPVEVDTCKTFLTRLTEDAAARGYEVSSTTADIYGARAGMQLEASCSSGRVELELFEYRGSAVSVEFSGDEEAGFMIAVDAQFPGVGELSHFIMLDDIDAESPRGVLNFSARTSTDKAFVEFDLDRETWVDGGAVTKVNDGFEATLRTSAVWKEAHVLSFAAAGLSSALDEGAMDALPLAVPSPSVPSVDADLVNQKKTCKAAGYICTAAAVFHKLIPGCAVAFLGCLASADCVQNDCAGDGGTTTG